MKKSNYNIVVIDDEKVVATTASEQMFVSNNVKTIATIYSDYDTANGIAIAYRCFLLDATRNNAKIL